MRKHFVKNDNLKRYVREFEEKWEDASDEVFFRILDELKHSNLIIAVEIGVGCITGVATFTHDGKKYGFLFTDMDEFRKFDPDGRSGSKEFDFEFYKEMVDNGFVEGFILNPESERFILVRDIFEDIGDLPQHDYLPDESYTSTELKGLRDSMDNASLEDFIKDPSNTGKYEELFAEISNSTLLTLMVSGDNLDGFAEDGIISMKDKPLGFLYIDKIGGRYATVYTSEDRISDVQTPLNKYSQIVNFSQITNYALHDDLDGIIINPNSDNVILTRDVLLDYWPALERYCNDQRLNTAIMHMFLIGEEA